MNNKINELLIQLENEIDNSPKPRLGASNKRIVNCDVIMDYIGDIKVSIPEEIRSAVSIMNEKEQILNDAKEEAAEMLSKARRESERMVSRQSVISEAKTRAQGIVLRAENNADVIAQGARNYTDEILMDLQHYLGEYVEIIEKNRVELNQAYGIHDVQDAKEEESEQESEQNAADSSNRDAANSFSSNGETFKKNNAATNPTPHKNEEVFETGKSEEVASKRPLDEPEADTVAPDKPQISYYKREIDEQERNRILEQATKGQPIPVRQSEARPNSAQEPPDSDLPEQYIEATDQNQRLPEQSAPDSDQFYPNKADNRDAINETIEKLQNKAQQNAKRSSGLHYAQESNSKTYFMNKKGEPIEEETAPDTQKKVDDSSLDINIDMADDDKRLLCAKSDENSFDRDLDDLPIDEVFKELFGMKDDAEY